MNTSEKVIQNLAERDEAQEQFNQVHAQLEKINKVLQSNEELKALFDKVAEELDKPKEEG